jgi:ABC-type branched-subunit amino acid transport system substrate-binding protein
LAREVTKQGRDTWFFVTVDYAFGHSLEADTTRAVLANGGKVLGSVRHPSRSSRAAARWRRSAEGSALASASLGPHFCA